MLDIVGILDKLQEQFEDVRLTIYKWEHSVYVRASVLYRDKLYHYQRAFNEAEQIAGADLESYYAGEVIRKVMRELSSE